MLKTCQSCKETKPIDDFFNDKSRATGKSHRCKVCDYGRKEKWRKAKVAARPPKPVKEPEPPKPKKAKVFQNKSRMSIIFRRIKQRCKEKSMDYDLDQYRHELRLRIDKGICEVSGLPIFHHTGKVEWDSISIDRIDSTKGYVYSNVRVVCYAVNVALNNWGLEQFLKVARAMETKYLIDNRANDRYNPHSKRVKTKWEIDQYERIFKKPLS